jgi:hypothetical protein
MMVMVLLNAQESMLVPIPMPRHTGKMACFAAFDLDKRVEKLRSKLNLPTGIVLKVVGGRECV